MVYNYNQLSYHHYYLKFMQEQNYRSTATNKLPSPTTCFPQNKNTQIPCTVMSMQYLSNDIFSKWLLSGKPPPMCAFALYWKLTTVYHHTYCWMVSVSTCFVEKRMFFIFQHASYCVYQTYHSFNWCHVAGLLLYIYWLKQLKNLVLLLVASPFLVESTYLSNSFWYDLFYLHWLILYRWLVWFCCCDVLIVVRIWSVLSHKRGYCGWWWCVAELKFCNLMLLLVAVLMVVLLLLGHFRQRWKQNWQKKNVNKNEHQYHYQLPMALCIIFEKFPIFINPRQQCCKDGV